MTAPRALRVARFAVFAVFALCATLAATAATGHAAPTAAALAKDRAAAAEKAFRSATAMHAVGRGTVDTVYAWSLRWLAAALETAPRAAKQALADHQKRMTDLEATVQKMFAAGTASSLDADGAAYFRIEADLWATRGKP
jgi:urease accessory protein UreF